MPRADTDRNLLFGIIALQMDFIARDQLIAAMGAWVLEKHRPVGEILVEKGALEPKHRALLEPVVDAHVERHLGDPATSLAAISPSEVLTAEFQQSITDPDLLQSIARMTLSTQDDPHATRAPEPADYPGVVRYRKLRDHARGGLGIVYVAHDSELKREVALKEIKPEYADNPTSQSRFLLEAEVTGGLEHPGIVPVYGLGHYEDGRPFYAMRFIKGDSLKESIADFHRDETLKKDPGARALALQKLLRRFLDVCNAIAYAHSRGVLHRDLKPDNVMVGRYGETLVVDWGLAKSVGRSSTDGFGLLPETTILFKSSSGSAETQPGSVIGTPSYMSPEQAAGRLDLLGPASDVYSLGATLYNLLTGRVPITGDNLQDVLRKVQRGDFPRPRESAPWLDPALEAVTLKAMALEPGSRYASPRELSGEIESWLADEPVAAYHEPIIRRAARWTRKHPRRATGLLTSCLIVAVGLGLVGWIFRAQRLRTEAAAVASLTKAEVWESRARSESSLPAWTEAIAEARQGLARLESGWGSADLKTRIEAKISSLERERTREAERIRAEDRDRVMVADLEEARLSNESIQEGKYGASATERAYAGLFLAYGIDVQTLSAEVAAARIRSSKIAVELITTLDDWSSIGSRLVSDQKLTDIIKAADLFPVGAAIRDAIARKDQDSLRGLLKDAKSRRELGMRSRRIVVVLMRLDPKANIPLLETLTSENPSDFWFNHDLAVAYLERVDPRKPADAVTFFRVAVAIRPKSPGLRFNLGNALKAEGRFDAAVAEYRQALNLKPDFAKAHVNLGVELAASGEIDAAIAEYREASRHDPDDSYAHFNHGNALKAKGDRDNAILEYRKAIQLQPDLAEAYTNLGVVLASKGELVEAIDQHRLALRARPGFAMAHNNLGNALNAGGNREAAIAEYREAIKLQPNFVEAHANLGIVLIATGEIDAAIPELQKAIQLQPDLAAAHMNLGNALTLKGDHEGGIAEFREVIRINPNRAEAYCNIGLIQKSLGRYPEALRSFERGHELGSKRAKWTYPTSQWIAETRRMISLVENLPSILKGEVAIKDPQERLGLAIYCSAQKLHGAAVRFYEGAFAEQPSLADDLSEAHRYHAACEAVMAGTGEGRDDPSPDEATRAKLRERGLAWLREDLAARSKLLDGNSARDRRALLQELDKWKKTPDLGSIRDEAALTKLPGAERGAFRAFWTDVDVFRRKAAEE